MRSSKTGSYSITLYKDDTTRYLFSKSYTIDSANTWEKKTITITPDSNIKASGGSIANDNGIGFYVFWNLAAGTNYDDATDNAWSSNTSHFNTNSQVNWMDNTSNNFYLTGVQLEVGDGPATPFEHEDFGTTLAKCQRYYFRTGYDGASNYFGAGGVYSSTQAMVMLPLPVKMRANPSAIDQSGTASHYGSWGNSATQVCSAVPVIRGSSSKTTCAIDLTFSSLNSATGTYVYRIVNASAYIGVSAEL